MNPSVDDWPKLIELAARDSWFDVSADDFAFLEIRRANEHFYYFYDTRRGALVKQFLLNESARVALLCEVTLVAKGDRYSPRARLMRVNKSSLKPIEQELATATRAIKASVDTEGGHENFMTLMSYVLGLKEVDVGSGTFRMAAASDLELVEAFRSRERSDIVSMVASILNSSLSEKEINLIGDRKSQIERFERLLRDPRYFSEETARLGKGPEALWQDFFESAQWIFGYGLSLVGHDALDSEKLEQITAGASIWGGAGKRSDAVMRSKAFISTLLFCEIKRHDTPLLKPSPYRPPDVYVASDELVGGIAQLQKTVRKSYRRLIDQVEEHTLADGTPTGLDFSTTRARQVLLAGDLQQFQTNKGLNGEKVESFELFRKAHPDIEVITFDELLARARFIVEG